MAYHEELADRVRNALPSVDKIEEKRMFRSLCFMLNGKVCVCGGKDELMCRINSKRSETVLQKNDTRPMIRNGKKIRGCVFVKKDAVHAQKDFDYWINLSLEFNKTSKSLERKK
jgi:ABC-type multidrug transport system ATPase subunit